jgi:hypothetical protein
MVSEAEAYFLKNIDIPSEADTVNFYAREIGFFDRAFESEDKMNLKQFYLYFLEHAEKELEKANERLKDFRAKLISFDQQQRQLHKL